MREGGKQDTKPVPYNLLTGKTAIQKSNYNSYPEEGTGLGGAGTVSGVIPSSLIVRKKARFQWHTSMLGWTPKPFSLKKFQFFILGLYIYKNFKWLFCIK